MCAGLRMNRQDCEMAGKWSKYGKKYRKEWETEKGLMEWIRSVPNDGKKLSVGIANVKLELTTVIW